MIAFAPSAPGTIDGVQPSSGQARSTRNPCGEWWSFSVQMRGGGISETTTAFVKTAEEETVSEPDPEQAVAGQETVNSHRAEQTPALRGIVATSPVPFVVQSPDWSVQATSGTTSARTVNAGSGSGHFPS